MLTLVRWGQAEYELGPLVGLPEGVRVVNVRDPKGPEADVPLEEADVVVVPSLRPIGPAQVARLRRCRLVVTSTSGYDHLDLDALSAAGIAAARLPLVRRDAVVESALGMLLALVRRFGDYREGAAADRWDRGELPRIGARRLGVVGVVGVGVIGSRMVDVLGALGSTVLPCDPALADGVPLDRVVAEADAITLHCELTPETRGLFDAARIAAMRPGAVLVNTARGKLVDADAAFAAVASGHLGGLGLDVFPTEPARLARWVHPRTILAPHAAGWHPRLGEAISEGVAAAVRALLAGEPVPFEVRAAAPRGTVRA